MLEPRTAGRAVEQAQTGLPERETRVGDPSVRPVFPGGVDGGEGAGGEATVRWCNFRQGRQKILGNNCPYLLQEALNVPSNSCSCCIWEVENGRAYRYGPQVHDDGRPRLTTDGQHTARTVTLSDSTQRGTTHRTGTTTSRQPHPALSRMSEL